MDSIPIPSRRRVGPGAYLTFLAAFAAIVVVLHLPYLDLPYFWDELGQFVPAALDIARRGAWVPHSTLPNVHPPAVMAYLALAWRVAGISIPATRVAMLLVASTGVLFVFLLAIELCRSIEGAPAFPVVALLLASPLFYTQSMLAQLDMPAMTLTALALLLFLQRKYRAAAAASTLLVLVKETGLVAPGVFLLWLLLRERRRREALYFVVPFAVLALWLVILRQTTGHWLGNDAFAEYNVFYSLNPVRAACALLRRLYYLLVAEGRWIGTAAIFLAWRKMRMYATPQWTLTAAVASAHILTVSLFGGATLERYLLPVLPLFYAAAAAGWSLYSSRWRRVSVLASLACLLAGFFWGPPWPWPLENNLAMIDFVQTQQVAANFLDEHMPRRRVASAWPFTQALSDPVFGYVMHRFRTVNTTDFRVSRVAAIPPGSVDALVIYSRTGEPAWSLTRFSPVAAFLRRYYDYEPQIRPDRVRRLGYVPAARWRQGAQWIDLYVNPAWRNSSPAPAEGERVLQDSPARPDGISNPAGLAWWRRNPAPAPGRRPDATRVAHADTLAPIASGRR